MRRAGFFDERFLDERLFDESGRPETTRFRPHPALVFAVIFAFIFLLHVPLLRLPYFWDEAGYYVPAARDILIHGSLIPTTTVSNAHPPLVLCWLALWWRVAGYDPLITRSAMLVVAAFALMGVFRLAQRVANFPVAMASTLCTALYPVFFMQSSMAHVDLAAAGFTIWGLCAYLEGHVFWFALWFSLAALSKETAILAPLALFAQEVFRLAFVRRFALANSSAGAEGEPGRQTELSSARLLTGLLIPLLPLIAWYGYHYSRTGYVFGNPEFFRYNVAATLSPIRFVLALGLRLWQAFGYLHLWVLTLAMSLAMFLRPLDDHGISRRRIAIQVQMVFLAVFAAYVTAMALIGGAVLARYLLPVIPLVMIVAVSTLWRRVLLWPAAVAVVLLAFVAAWFWNPPYGFSFEDNLAYRDYIQLHEEAESFLEARYPMARVLTAWPASEEITRPWLGYITRPMQVVRIEDFSADEVFSAADFRANFDVALIFSTKYEPARDLLGHSRRWEALKTRYFGFHRDLPPAAVAQVLGGRIVFPEVRKGQWVAVMEMKQAEVQEAKNGGQGPRALTHADSEALTFDSFRVATNRPEGP